MIGFGMGTDYYCFYDKQFRWEILIARPINGFQKWIRGFNKRTYHNSKVFVVQFSGVVYRETINQRADKCKGVSPKEDSLGEPYTQDKSPTA